MENYNQRFSSSRIAFFQLKKKFDVIQDIQFHNLAKRYFEQFSEIAFHWYNKDSSLFSDLRCIKIKRSNEKRCIEFMYQSSTVAANQSEELQTRISTVSEIVFVDPNLFTNTFAMCSRLPVNSFLIKRKGSNFLSANSSASLRALGVSEKTVLLLVVSTYTWGLSEECCSSSVATRIFMAF